MPSSSGSNSLGPPTAAVTVTLEGTGQKSSLNLEALSEVSLFYLNLAHRAGQRWGLDSLSLPQISVSEDVDAQINQDALAALKQLLEIQPQLHHTLFTEPEHKAAFQGMMSAGLLNLEHEAVRNNTYRFGERLAQSSSGQGHYYLLDMLSHLELADSFPHHCAEYYRLLTEIIRTISNTPPQVREAEVAVAKNLLDHLVQESAHLVAVGEEDVRMEGKLRLLLELVQALDCRVVGNCSHGSLVHRIIVDYLFPESCFLQRLRDARHSILYPSLSATAKAMQARCSSKGNRKAALDLLEDLMSHDSINFREGTDLICLIHLRPNIMKLDQMDHSPATAGRKAFVGLKNAGATCYLNSVFQQIFMQPSIRRLILSAPEVPRQERPDSVFYQLQSTFAYLALSNREWYRPVGFWKAFKDYDGEPLNVREHQDAYEFFTRLQDLIDQQMQDTKQKPVMQLVMGGKFAQQIICKGLPYKSEKEEDFYQVSLDVRGKQTLEESLDFYVQGELMEGDNQYLCEELGKKVDAVKRNCIKVLPHMLVIHLKRFEYDYTTMNRWKIKDRFEFPEEIDMYKYTVIGLEEREANEAAAAARNVENPDRPPSRLGTEQATSQRDTAQSKYYLKGIVVHSGTAFAGHYYSYIKVRSEKGHDVPHAGQWFCFDDNSVDPWDIQNLDKDCFGGKYHADLPDGFSGSKAYDRPNSAYMLFYERADSLEPVTMMDEITASAPQEAASLATSVPVSAVSQTTETAEAMEATSARMSADPELQPEASSSGRDLSTVPIPDVKESIPSVCEAIMLNNLKFLQEIRLLDREYFRFLFRLVKRKAEEPFSPPSSMRRTEPTSSSSMSCPDSPDHVSSRREAGADEAAERLMELAALFLLKIMLKCAPQLREDQREWAVVAHSIIDSSVAANRWLLQLLSKDKPEEEASLGEEVIDSFLVWCDQEDISKFVACLIAAAIRNAALKDNALPVLRPQKGSSSWAVQSILVIFLDAMQRRDFMQNKSNLQDFCSVLREYGHLGHEYRTHPISLRILKFALMQINLDPNFQKIDELMAVLGVVAVLARSLTFEKDEAPNPYATHDGRAFMGQQELLELMTNANNTSKTCVCKDLLFWPHFWHYEDVKNLLLFLLWQNEAFTRAWLHRFLQQFQNLTADTIHAHCKTFVQLVAVGDGYKESRIRMVLFNNHTRADGLLMQAADIRSNSQLQASRRFAMIRFILMLVQEEVQVHKDLEGHPCWFHMVDWIERVGKQQNSISRQPEFDGVYRTMHALMSLSQSSQSQESEDDVPSESTSNAQEQ